MPTGNWSPSVRGALLPLSLRGKPPARPGPLWTPTPDGDYPAAYGQLCGEVRDRVSREDFARQQAAQPVLTGTRSSVRPVSSPAAPSGRRP